MTINSSPSRTGNFTSSGIAPLTTKGKQALGFDVPAITYIEEKKMERRLGRSIKTESNARPLAWGKMMERYVFDQLGTEYTLTSDVTDIHPIIPYWSGSKDGLKRRPNKAVIDMKCPMTLKSFCQLVDPIYDGLEGIEAMNAVRDNHKSGEDYYWQLVSNAILNDVEYAELIIFMPYLSEIPAIRQLADGNSAMYWLTYAEDDYIPYLIDGGYYQNINKIFFKVPQADKDFLTSRVELAGQLLLPKAALSYTFDRVNDQPVIIVEKNKKPELI